MSVVWCHINQMAVCPTMIFNSWKLVGLLEEHEDNSLLPPLI